MAEYPNVKCTVVYNHNNTCENCVKNKLNNCISCPLFKGKCSACKHKNG